MRFLLLGGLIALFWSCADEQDLRDGNSGPEPGTYGFYDEYYEDETYDGGSYGDDGDVDAGYSDDGYADDGYSVDGSGDDGGATTGGGGTTGGGTTGGVDGDDNETDCGDISDDVINDAIDFSGTIARDYGDQWVTVTITKRGTPEPNSYGDGEPVPPNVTGHIKYDMKIEDQSATLHFQCNEDGDWELDWENNTTTTASCLTYKPDPSYSGNLTKLMTMSKKQTVKSETNGEAGEGTITTTVGTHNKNIKYSQTHEREKWRGKPVLALNEKMVQVESADDPGSDRDELVASKTEYPVYHNAGVLLTFRQAYLNQDKGVDKGYNYAWAAGTNPATQDFGWQVEARSNDGRIRLGAEWTGLHTDMRAAKVSQYENHLINAGYSEGMEPSDELDPLISKLQCN